MLNPYSGSGYTGYTSSPQLGCCDPGTWNGGARIALLVFTAASALAAVGTFFFVLFSRHSLPPAYWALPSGLAVLSGGLFFIWKISVYRNCHLAGEQFRLCGYRIGCLSDP